MDFVRFDTIDFGPVYIRPEQIVLIGKIDDTRTNVSVMLGGNIGKDFEIATDPDELALSIERAYPGFRFYRVD